MLDGWFHKSKLLWQTFTTVHYFVVLQMSDGQNYTILLHLQIHLKCKCCCCWLENLGLMFRFSAVSNAAWVQAGRGGRPSQILGLIWSYNNLPQLQRIQWLQMKIQNWDLQALQDLYKDDCIFSVGDRLGLKGAAGGGWSKPFSWEMRQSSLSSALPATSTWTFSNLI